MEHRAFENKRHFAFALGANSVTLTVFEGAGTGMSFVMVDLFAGAGTIDLAHQHTCKHVSRHLPGLTRVKVDLPGKRLICSEKAILPGERANNQELFESSHSLGQCICTEWLLLHLFGRKCFC